MSVGRGICFFIVRRLGTCSPSPGQRACCPSPWDSRCAYRLPVPGGQQKSFEEMTRIRDLIDPEGERNIPCYHGADGYLPDIHTPCPSEAVENIIRIVKEADGIVYFGMLGCFTNMASALLTEPSIREKVVVIMIGANRFGYHTNNEFNLMQDRAAARVILECGVPVVVLPAMEATERITTTTGEVYYYLKGKTGNIGNYLCKIYAEDEWVPDDAEGNCSSSQRSLWDLAAVALLRLADQIGDLQMRSADNCMCSFRTENCKGYTMVSVPLRF